MPIPGPRSPGMKSEDLGCALGSVVFKVVQDAQPSETEETSCDFRQGQESVGGGGVSRTFIQGGLMAFSMYWALSLALGFQTQNDATRWAWGLQWGPIEG